MAEQFNQAPDPLTSGASLREGAKYYFGTVSAIAGAIGVAGEISTAQIAQKPLLALR